MLHSKRIWSISPVESAESLANKLAQCTWTCCCSFELDGYIFANDATSGDGAQEFAVLMPSSSGEGLVQIESITFSWCTEVESLSLIHRVTAGDFAIFRCVMFREIAFKRSPSMVFVTYVLD